MTPKDNHWSFDKRIPVAVILSVLVGMMGNTAGVVWWAATSSSRLDRLEEFMTEMRSSDARIARLEQITTMQTTTLNRIEGKLDRVVERQNEH